MTSTNDALYRSYTDEEIARITRTYHPIGTYRLICEICGEDCTCEGCATFLRKYTIDDSKSLDEVLATLTARERQILEHRFGLYDARAFCDTLQSLGDSFGVTRERIRQIEEKALRKMRHPTRICKIEGMIPPIKEADDAT